MTVEVGWMHFAHGIAGDWLLALDPESMEDAYAAHPGVPLYRPREIGALKKIKALSPGGEAVVALCKAVFAEGSRWGAVIEAVNVGRAEAEAA